MTSTNYLITRYDSSPNCVFDWKEERWYDVFDENMHVIGREQEHLYAKTLFIGGNDSIDNYIEVDAPREEE